MIVAIVQFVSDTVSYKSEMLD